MGFGGRGVGINSRQLGQRDGHGPALPADQHEHIGGAGIFRCHTLDFDGFPFPERRNYRGRDALGLKRESDFVIEVAMPSHGLLFRPIGVRDGFVVDAVLPVRVFLAFLHDFAPRIRRTEVRGYGAPSQSTLEARSAKSEVSREYIQNVASPMADFSELLNNALGTFSVNPNGVGLGDSKTFFILPRRRNLWVHERVFTGLLTLHQALDGVSFFPAQPRGGPCVSRKRWNLRQVESKERCSSSEPL
jgi:hypothetical protein